MQKNVETVLVAVLLELREGDEFSHEEVSGRREKGGRRSLVKLKDDWRDFGQQMGAGLYEQTSFPRGKQDYAAGKH